jgi:hypothetical protein
MASLDIRHGVIVRFCTGLAEQNEGRNPGGFSLVH